jgi:hypothetical protein
MPLTEEQRGVLVDYFASNIDFLFEGYDFQVEVYRLNEGFSINHPNILVNFLPANRKKFQSLSDVLGRASGRYYDYGYCHIEMVTVSVYCNEFHSTEDGSINTNGRELCSFLANQCLRGVLKDWEVILKQFGASFDRRETIPIVRDLSTYDDETETKIYNYVFDVLLRTQLRWNKVPDDYDEDSDIAEKAVLEPDLNGD